LIEDAKQRCWFVGNHPCGGCPESNKRRGGEKRGGGREVGECAKSIFEVWGPFGL